jgi:hypothetical protein
MITATEQQILVLLERKQQIDALGENQFTQRQRWIVDATELLLRHQLELRTELRNAGILR